MTPEITNNPPKPTDSTDFSQKGNTLGNNFSSAVFYLAILFFIIGFNFSDVMVGNWYQQFLPAGLPNFQVSDMYFQDSLTGYIVTGNSSPNDSSGYILKTTNAGNNWTLKFAEFRDFSRVKFINQNTGYVSGGHFNGARLYKTTNGGENWFPSGIPGGQIYINDVSLFNEDTIWLAIDDALTGGVFFTSNGGANWQQQYGQFSNNPDKIYMFNQRIGFISTGNRLRKTTDGGSSWSIMTGTGTGAFADLYFIDSLTGWKAKEVGGGGWLFGKSTDGGNNWVEQNIPTGLNITADVRSFSNINEDTIWAGGGEKFFPGNGTRGILNYTTNGGVTWYYQVIDTSFGIPRFFHIQFTDKLIGWAYSFNSKGIHTTNGGDTAFYLPVNQISSEVPNEFKLYQNYPNPFNPKSNIKYQISKGSVNVKIAVFDITGKLVAILINEKHGAGTYELSFDGSAYSSGVYFYSLIIEGKVIDTKKMLLIK